MSETFNDVGRFAAELLRRGHPRSQVRAVATTAGRFASEGTAVVIEVADLVLELRGRNGHRREHRPAKAR